MTEFLPQIDSAKCFGCGLCVTMCPNTALGLVNDVAVVVNPHTCNYTGACQAICPIEVINLVYEIVFSEGQQRHL